MIAIQLTVFCLFLLAEPSGVERNGDRSEGLGQSVAGLPEWKESWSLERIAIERVAALGLIDRVELYLGAPRLRLQRGAMRPTERTTAFLSDPAVRGLGAIDPVWFEGMADGLFRTARQLVELQVMVARNLNQQQRAISRSTVRQQVRKIRVLRSLYAATTLFADRAVVYAVSDDAAADRRAFGRSPVRRAVARQAGRFSFLRSSDLTSRRYGRPAAFLALQMTGREPITLFFEGHGRARAVDFGGRLSDVELARVLPAGDAESPHILIAAACRGHDFVRRVLDEMRRQRPGDQLPIVVVPQEYGQDFVVDVASDTFKRMELGLGLRHASIGELFTSAHPATSVYVPDENNLPIQIL